jgi:hypothetical protein
VSDGSLESEVVKVVVNVKQVNQAPVANAGSNQSVNEGSTVSLSGSGSTDPDSDALTYKWTNTQGILLDLTDPAKPTFTAPEVTKNTDFTFYLQVSDGSLESEVVKVVVNVKQVNQAPVANAGSNQSVNEGSTVSLSGSGSTDPDSDALTYKWTNTQGILLDLTDPAKPTFTAPEVTEDTQYTFTLVVNDGQVDSPSDVVVITVLNVNNDETTGNGIGVISGYVYEEAGSGTKSVSITRTYVDNKNPVEGVQIRLYKSGGTSLVATTLTDSNGFYKFEHLEIAEYAIFVEIPGFVQSEEFKVAVSDKEPSVSFKFLVNSSTGSVTDVNPVFLSSVKIYPNPTKGKVQLKFSQIPDAGTWISVYDASGRLVLKSPALDLEESINLEGNPAGLYFIKLNQKSSKTYKLVLE